MIQSQSAPITPDARKKFVNNGVPTRIVKTTCTILILLLLSVSAFAQKKAAQAQDDGLQLPSLDEWMKDNIDPDALRVLNQLDEERTRRIFSELQQAMNGTNIYQLGTLRETAAQLLPVLQKFEETAPYAAWLQTHLDYLEVSQEFQREMKTGTPKSGAPWLLPGPALKSQRQVWVRTLDKRPWPALAQNYVPQLKQIFISERMPPELVWVAEVESSFNAVARSPVGAAGMFQLMPQTARDEQLSLWPRDERLQPEKSARAAARYLRALHTHYGDWQLALAAYNAGERRVDKLLKEQSAHSFEAIARCLPAETQMYVPKVEATVRKREGKELDALKLPKV
jgi:membrane-bound lytic murein transglycosylase D